MLQMLDTGSVPSWPICKSQYELGSVIGVGATAVVHQARCIPRNELCAIKRINLEKLHSSMDELLKEIQVMSACHHENVVTYYTSFVVNDELWLVLKLLSGGSLLDVIKHRMKACDCKCGVLSEAVIATVMKEVLKGLEYFHSSGQIHRDIKAGNILIGSDGSVQVADFGVSSWLSTGGDMCRDRTRHTFVGTPCWMAPEVMEQVNGYDFKADIWSFGITVIELITGAAPYHKYPPMKVLMLTLQNDPPCLDLVDKDRYRCYGKTIRRLISDCLQKDPFKRPTASELLKHAFFKKAKDKKFIQQTLLSSGLPKQVDRLAKLRMPGSSGRFHKTDEGDWVWSSGSSSDSEVDDEETSCATLLASSSIHDKLHANNTAKTATAGDAAQNGSTVSTPAADTGETPTLSGGASDAETGPPPPSACLSTTAATQHTNKSSPLHFILRMRNNSAELHDIRFEYDASVDTADSVAQELVTAGLLDGRDRIVVAAKLQTLVDDPGTVTNLTFPLTLTYCEPHERSELSLVGYGQLTLHFPDNDSPQSVLSHTKPFSA